MAYGRRGLINLSAHALRGMTYGARRNCIQQQSFPNLVRISFRYFADTRAMAGSKIDGNAIAKGIREKLNAQIQKTQQSNPRYKPSLVIIQGLQYHRPWT